MRRGRRKNRFLLQTPNSFIHDEIKMVAKDASFTFHCKEGLDCPMKVAEIPSHIRLSIQSEISVRIREETRYNLCRKWKLLRSSYQCNQSPSATMREGDNEERERKKEIFRSLDVLLLLHQKE